ncbi:MAG: RebB family R body protein [Magnetospirillum sp. WYHS-4]
MFPPRDAEAPSQTQTAHAGPQDDEDDEAPCQPMPNQIVAPQITDAITQANVTSLGSGPAISVVQSYLSMSQAQGVLFANMVSNQQQLAIASHATTVEAVSKILNLGGGSRK